MKNSFLQTVERFVTVAEEGSIQGAARQLNISQPSLTVAISKIEEGFGTRLFDRTKRGVVLTRAGDLLYPRAKRILAEGAMAGREIDDLIGGQIGRFHVRAGSSWGFCYLPEIMADLKHRYPDLDVQFNLGNTTNEFPQLSSGKIDAIIGKMEDDTQGLPGIECVRLVQMRFVIVCAKSHPLAEKEVVSREDLAGCPFVAYEPDLESLSSILAPISDGQSDSIRVAMRTRSPHAALEIAETGNFAACLSMPFVQKYKSRSLRILKTNFQLHEIATGIYYRETLTPTEPFKTLLTSLKRAARLIEKLD